MTEPTQPMDAKALRRLGLLLAEIARSASIIKESLPDLYQHLGRDNVGIFIASGAEAHSERIGLLADFAQATFCGGTLDTGGVAEWLLPPDFSVEKAGQS